jgi:sulfur carrier protein ThiS
MRDTMIGEIPRLLIAAGLDEMAALAPSMPQMVADGVDGLLIFAGSAAPEDIERGVAAARSEAAGLPLLIAGSPGVAGNLTAGAVLSERGIGSAEARRLLGPGRLLGREVWSAAAAALAEGLDFLVCDLADLGPEGVLAAVQTSWSPVLVRIASAADARAAIRAGAEGVIVPVAAAALLREIAACLPQREVVEQVVTLDGVPTLLEPDTAVTDLLADAGRDDARSVSINGVAVPRRVWDDRLLAPGDVIETG